MPRNVKSSSTRNEAKTDIIAVKRKHYKSFRKITNDSAQPIELIKVLEKKRIQECLYKKELKESTKSKETPEEKRTRRLREKQAKEIRRRQRMGWDTEYQHYSNQDNPFGDPNLMSSFVWTKKLEKEGYKNVDAEAVEILSRQKQVENKIELQKVKKRRIERELERQTREEELLLAQRSREATQFQEWERQEDKFHLEQAKLRSVIRIQDGRAKPIDLLAQYINSNLDLIEMQMHEPYHFLNGLGVKDLEDLIMDIKVYIEVEKGNNNDFWNDMIVIVEDELKKLRKLNLDSEIEAKVGRREGIHQSVAKDVCNIFKGKTTAQLNELRCRIEDKILRKDDGIDISYWESLFSQLKAHMARARLLDRHQENLKQKLIFLKSNRDEADFGIPTTSHIASKIVNNVFDNSDKYIPDNDTFTEKNMELCCELYEKGRYSPKYFSRNEICSNAIVLSEEQDAKETENSRNNIVKAQSMTRQEFEMYTESRREMSNEEAAFSVESILSSEVNLETDKYRPRKPRYFNRVHTGFEWNKYNQTHYDMDNPPPKIVQGYKFNIFYPDLIDKTSTPQYILTPCEDNTDFSVLRFHSGPPYEDIAFKIVNREWEFSYKRGFRCQFHNNIFQLWFHFKRYRYRR